MDFINPSTMSQNGADSKSAQNRHLRSRPKPVWPVFVLRGFSSVWEKNVKLLRRKNFNGSTFPDKRNILSVSETTKRSAPSWRRWSPIPTEKLVRKWGLDKTQVKNDSWNILKLGSIRCKRTFRWQQLFLIKLGCFDKLKKFYLQLKQSRLIWD